MKRDNERAIYYPSSRNRDRVSLYLSFLTPFHMNFQHLRRRKSNSVKILTPIFHTSLHITPSQILLLTSSVPGSNRIVFLGTGDCTDTTRHRMGRLAEPWIWLRLFSLLPCTLECLLGAGSSCRSDGVVGYFANRQMQLDCRLRILHVDIVPSVCVLLLVPHGLRWWFSHW
jgi:hypothetical protein